MLQPPLASEFDPAESDETSIDPLGLATTYERLADQMLGNVTVRMTRIRLVTAIAVGAVVAETWDDGEVAKDEVSTADMVFEWLTLIAFVRPGRGGAEERLRRVGGMQKVKRALLAGNPISAKTYLKTPRVFGFSGVFRRFAEGTGVLDRGGRLEDAGRSLIKAWERDRGLTGFLDGNSDSEGGRFLAALRKVVRTGMAQGHIATNDLPNTLSDTLFTHLNPDGLIDRRPQNGNEQRALRELIRSGAASTGRWGRPDHRECSEFLFDRINKHGRQLSQLEEADFLRTLTRNAPIALKTTLEQIDAYESLCRPLRDTLDWMRWSHGERGTPIDRAGFGKTTQSAVYLDMLLRGVARVASMEALHMRHPEVRTLLERFGEVRSADELFDRVIEHHHLVQRDKPPSGKRPWFEPAGRGAQYVVRPAYVLDAAPPTRKSADRAPYVHEYRIPTLSRFLRDIGEVE
jgi:hypothetical protein